MPPRRSNGASICQCRVKGSRLSEWLAGYGATRTDLDMSRDEGYSDIRCPGAIGKECR